MLSVLHRRRPLWWGAFLLAAVSVFAAPDPILDALRNRQFDAALALCNKQLRVQPGNARVWTLKGLALQNLNKPQEALAAYRKAASLAPRSVPALEGAAQIEYQTRDPRCAATLGKIVALQPDSAPAHGMLGVLAYERKACKAAVEHFEKAGPALNGNAPALWQFGNCLYELQRPDDAAAKFKLLLAMKDHDPVRYNLGLALLDARQPHEAAETLAPLATRPVPDSDALGLLAAAYEADKQTANALKALRQAADLYPREERHYIDFASICMEHRALDLGIEVLEVGTRNIPKSARLHATLGALLVRAAKMDAAEREFQIAQELDPKAAYGNMGMSLALLQANQVAESIQLLRSQMAGRRDNPMLAFLLAQALLRDAAEPGQPQFEEAKTLLEGAVKQDPGLARAHGLLGKTYALAGEREKARRELETALKLDPVDRTSAYQLALVYSQSGEKELAAKMQRRVREILDWEKTTERDRNRILRAAPERSAEP
ncbi:MAG TPA: tetratricopeptide repeat protein [Bryobacteraceae bacterium]|nr:tetratricopeptide repeat protein [Bryobacteraceae bacterium]